MSLILLVNGFIQLIIIKCQICIIMEYGLVCPVICDYRSLIYKIKHAVTIRSHKCILQGNLIPIPGILKLFNDILSIGSDHSVRNNCLAIIIDCILQGMKCHIPSDIICDLHLADRHDCLIRNCYRNCPCQLLRCRIIRFPCLVNKLYIRCIRIISLTFYLFTANSGLERIMEGISTDFNCLQQFRSCLGCILKIIFPITDLCKSRLYRCTAGILTCSRYVQHTRDILFNRFSGILKVLQKII